MRSFITIMLLVFSLNGISQDKYQYTYTFKLQQITTAEEAKHRITEIRAILEVKVIYFDDETYYFRMLSDNEWDPTLLAGKLSSYGMPIDGVITITENE